MSTTILLLGRTYPVSPPSGPSGFTSAEEWMIHAGTENVGFRVLGAAIGLTTSLGKELGESLEKHKYDVLSYGGAIWGHLRQKGASVAELTATASVCFPAIVGLVTPKEVEVQSAQDFILGGATST